jgi:hypothetical protein
MTRRRRSHENTVPVESPPFPKLITVWPPRNSRTLASCQRSGCAWHTEGSEAEITEAAWRHVEMHETRCSHAQAIPVENSGETVAALCPACSLQLPAAWLSCDHDGMSIEIPDRGTGLHTGGSARAAASSTYPQMARRLDI